MRASVKRSIPYFFFAVVIGISLSLDLSRASAQTDGGDDGGDGGASSSEGPDCFEVAKSDKGIAEFNTVYTLKDEDLSVYLNDHRHVKITHALTTAGDMIGYEKIYELTDWGKFEDKKDMLLINVALDSNGLPPVMPTYECTEESSKLVKIHREGMSTENRPCVWINTDDWTDEDFKSVQTNLVRIRPDVAYIRHGFFGQFINEYIKGRATLEVTGASRSSSPTLPVSITKQSLLALFLRNNDAPDFGWSRKKMADGTFIDAEINLGGTRRSNACKYSTNEVQWSGSCDSDNENVALLKAEIQPPDLGPRCLNGLADFVDQLNNLYAALSCPLCTPLP